MIKPLLLSAFLSTISPTDQHCLSLTTYFEARGTNQVEWSAINHTVINRVLSDKYPNTICEVVKSKCQFSWYCDGKSDIPSNKKVFENIKQFNEDWIDNFEWHYDFTSGADHYHAKYVNPYWSQEFEEVFEGTDHKFYVSD